MSKTFSFIFVNDTSYSFWENVFQIIHFPRNKRSLNHPNKALTCSGPKKESPHCGAQYYKFNKKKSDLKTTSSSIPKIVAVTIPGNVCERNSIPMATVSLKKRQNNTIYLGNKSSITGQFLRVCMVSHSVQNSITLTSI